MASGEVWMLDGERCVELQRAERGDPPVVKVLMADRQPPAWETRLVSLSDLQPELPRYLGRVDPAAT